MRTSVCPRCGSPRAGAASAEYCPRCAGRLLLDLTELPADEADASVRVPVLRLGEYELGAELGRGAMGAVYRARQPRLKRDVAVKVILASRFGGETAQKRFLAEAELAAQLDHPNVVPIYEVGETPEGPFYVMKLVEGETLAQRMRSGECERRNEEGASADPSKTPHSAFRIPHSAHLLAQISRAVHHAHQRGVLHRDLKPGNILIDAQGEPHVTDFGLARQLGAESSLTQTGWALGTPAYMSPEQAVGERGITTAADIWSLGAMLFHLLTGRPPFIGESVADILLQVGTREAPSLRVLNPAVPRDLETICLKCLEKDPARRYVSAMAFAEDLERWSRGEPILARPVSTPEKFRLWCRRHPAIAGLSAAVVLLLLIVAVGSPIAVVRVAKGRKTAEEATQRAEGELRKSLQAQARSGRLSHERSFRQKGLAAIATAAKIRPSLELRNEALAHLILPDLENEGDRMPGEGEVIIHFPPDLARYVVYAGSGTNQHVSIRRWPDHAELSRWYPTPTDGPSFRLMPNPRFMLTTTQATYEMVDLEQRQTIYRRPFGMNKVFDQFGGYDFSADGRRVAWLNPASDGEQRQWEVVVLNLDPPKELARIRTDAPGLAARQISFGRQRIKLHPTEPAVAFITGKTLEVRDWDTGGLRDQFKSDVLWSEVDWQQDLLAARDQRGLVQVWNMKTRQPVFISTRHNGPMLLSPNGDLLLSHDSFTHDTSVFDPRTGNLLLTTTLDRGSTFSRDATRLSYLRAKDGSAGLWRVVRPKGFRTISFDRIPTQLDFSSDGQRLAIGAGRGLQILDVHSGQPLALELSHPLTECRFLPDGKTAVGRWSRTNTIPLWPVEYLEGPTGRIVRFDPPRTIAVAGSNEVYQSVLSADRRWLAASWERKGKYGGMMLDLQHPERPPVNCPFGSTLLALSSAGRFVATPNRVIEVATGRRVRRFDETNSLDWANFSSDGRWLATTTAKDLRVYECASWQLVHQSFSNSLPLTAGFKPSRPVFSPDSTLLGLLSDDQLRIELFSTAPWQHVATLAPPDPGSITFFEFSSLGVLAVATERGIIQFWDLPALRRELRDISLDWTDGRSLANR